MVNLSMGLTVEIFSSLGFSVGRLHCGIRLLQLGISLRGSIMLTLGLTSWIVPCWHLLQEHYIVASWRNIPCNDVQFFMCRSKIQTAAKILHRAAGKLWWWRWWWWGEIFFLFWYLNLFFWHTRVLLFDTCGSRFAWHLSTCSDDWWF